MGARGDAPKVREPERMTPERLQEIRDLIAVATHFGVRTVAALVNELAAVTRESESLRTAVRDFLDCHDSGGFEAEGQALGALRAVYERRSVSNA